MKKAAKKAAKKVPRRPAAEKPAPAEWQPATEQPLELGESAKEFQKNGDKRNWLLAILRHPYFREAEAILKDEQEPRADLPIFLTDPTVCSHRFHQRAGLNYFIDGLKRLTKLPVEVKIPQPKRLSTLADLEKSKP